ncbi:MAG TPA: rhomboid family intramembrane serine protease [Armatimonadota bacterium]|nr:rhomboid family intramembrane serine protease [Armatimonadota bacterium]
MLCAMPFPVFQLGALPLKTDRTLRAVPYVTYALCFVNLAVFLGQISLTPSALYQVQQQWGFILTDPRPAALFTHGFLHADIFHLTGNLLLLWLVGTVLESGIGGILFLLLYFAGLLAAILLYAVIGQACMPASMGVPLIGASGAIAGVTGLAAFRYYRLRVLTLPLLGVPGVPVPLPVPVPLWVPFWGFAVLFAAREMVAGVGDILSGASGGVAHWAHIGGLLLGVLAAALTRAVPDAVREYALEDSPRAAADVAQAKRKRREVERLLWDHPDDPELLEALAGLLLASGTPERCRDLYRKAITHFLAQGKPERAAISYLNLLRAFPDSVLAVREQMRMALSLEELGHADDALDAYCLLTEHYPDSDDAQTALVRAAQLSLRHRHDPAEAERLLRLLLDRYPASPWRQLALSRLEEQ